MLLIFNYVIMTKMGWGVESFSTATTIVSSISLFVGYYLAVIILEPFFIQYDKMDKEAKNTLHEMNIPVATIKANTQMLQKSIKDEKNQKKLTRILSSCDTLIELYNELDYGLKDTISTIKDEQFDLLPTIQKISSEFSDIFTTASINIDIPSTIVKTDRIGFEKVVRNLVENALKYSMQRQEINISYKNNILKIQDYGIGMDSIEILNIYERYYQIDKETKGYGIGLNLVKQFCDNHKIAISIDSIKNQGTTISLNLQNINSA